MGIRLRLWQRLFIAFAGLSILALATFAVLQQQGLRSGFLDYLNRLSMERVAEGATRLGQRYDATGNWDFVRDRPGEFMRIIGLPPPEPARPQPGGRGGAGGAPEMQDPPPDRGPPDAGPPDRRPPPPGAWPPPPRGGPRGGPPPFARGRDLPPPPDAGPDAVPADNSQPAAIPASVDSSAAPSPSSASDESIAVHDDSRARDQASSRIASPASASDRDFVPPMPEREPPPPRPAGPLDLAARLLLVDASDRYVVGNPEVPEDSPFVPVMSHGTLVGRLLLAPMPKLRGDLDLSFAQTQLRHALQMAGAVLLGALVAAWLLARWLLEPIRALGTGTRALVAGRFAARIPATRNDELGALAGDFNQLAAALERNQDARRRWGADIAHELRTPIGILRGEIQALQDGIRPVGRETLASLQGECDRLAALVEDLYQLALSDVSALAYRMEAVDLYDLLREVVAAHAGAMHDAGLELALDASPLTNLPVQGDAQRLMQLFGNLLRNSLRYTHAPGRVRIAARCVGGDVLVEVEDTAPGVPAEALAHLFDRLYRVESSRSREFGGAGLGLAISRNIAQAHGGQIVAAASAMGGLCVSLRLPLAEDAS
ncbi:MAG TPA: ATP-binding protein [Xanthomonadaceae bacterium]|jgi:two-component system sensor histidine kinase BaeS